MSREFGSHSSGYFHDQIDFAASDCREGRDPLTKLWGEWFRRFYDIAYAISSSEACDSGPDFPIMETIQRMESLQEQFHAIEQFVAPYKRCMERAVEELVKPK